jgi:hypothetical protein
MNNKNYLQMESGSENFEDNFSLEDDLLYLKARLRYVLQVLEKSKLEVSDEN